MSNSLRPHELQHARPPWPSAAPVVYSNSCPLSQWCHPTISSSVIPFSYCLQSFPASGCFPRSQFFASGGQSVGVSASASVLPMNIQDWFPLGLTGRISLQSKGLSRVFSIAAVRKHQFFGVQLYGPTLTSIHDHWKNHSFDYPDLCQQSNVSAFKYTVLVDHSFSSKEQVSFNFMAAVTICSDFGAQENEVCQCFHSFPIYLPWSDGTGCHDLSFLNVEF